MVIALLERKKKKTKNPHIHIYVSEKNVCFYVYKEYLASEDPDEPVTSTHVR